METKYTTPLLAKNELEAKQNQKLKDKMGQMEGLAMRHMTTGSTLEEAIIKAFKETFPDVKSFELINFKTK